MFRVAAPEIEGYDQAAVRRTMPSGLSPSRTRLISAGAVVVLVATTLVPLGFAGALHRDPAIVPAATDPILVGGLAGYGVRPSVSQDALSAMAAAWTEPSVNCSNTTSTRSIAVEAGLDRYGSRIDGLGILAVCLLGTTLYYPFADQAPYPATILTGLLVNPGDFVVTHVNTSGWFISDESTSGTTYLFGNWSAPISTALSHNSVECVVARGTSLGVLPSAFHLLPTSSPTVLQPPVQFGQLYPDPGCDYLDPVAGIYEGIGNVSSPFVGETFQLVDGPPLGSVIAPQPATNDTSQFPIGPWEPGSYTNDSFALP